MTRLLCVLLLFCTACGLADDERDEENKRIYLTFYDKAFEAYCLENFDSNHDGRISRYEAQRVLRMECSGRGIASMTDIRDFVNLQRLDCSDNALTQLDLTASTRLERLDCADNTLVSLDINGLRSLTELNCSANRLPNLDLRSNASLAQLECWENALTTLDLKACSANLRADVRANPALTTVYALPSQNVSFDGQTVIQH